MDMSTLYWLTRVEPLGNTISTLLVTTALIGGFYMLMRTGHLIIDKKQEVDVVMKPYIKWILVWLFIMFANVLIPDNKSLAVILGGYYAVNNEELSKMPTKAGAVINKFMDNYLEEKKD